MELDLKPMERAVLNQIKSSGEGAQVYSMLSQVLTLLDHGRAWTTGTAARTPCGSFVHPRHVSATRWCIHGAMERIGGSLNLTARLLDAMTEFHYTTFNDTRSWEDVEWLLQRAMTLVTRYAVGDDGPPTVTVQWPWLKTKETADAI